MSQKGFTLIELIVAVAIFSIVMTLALGALLSMSESDRRAQALKSVINNLNFSLDSMSRTIRTGTTYNCDVAGLNLSVPLTTPDDCTSPAASSFAFRSAGGQNVAYQLETSNASLCGQATGAVGCITRSVAGGAYAPLTSPEVRVTRLDFYVIGAESANIQPKVTIIMSGTVSVSGVASSDFTLQTSVTQRLYDQQ